MNGGPKSSLRPFLHRALQLFRCKSKFSVQLVSLNLLHYLFNKYILRLEQCHLLKPIQCTRERAALFEL